MRQDLRKALEGGNGILLDLIYSFSLHLCVSCSSHCLAMLLLLSSLAPKELPALLLLQKIIPTPCIS